LFKAEFGISEQPCCGGEHVKGGRARDHWVYSMVRPSGAVVGLAFEYAAACGHCVFEKRRERSWHL